MKGKEMRNCTAHSLNNLSMIDLTHEDGREEGEERLGLRRYESNRTDTNASLLGETFD
jgi:hypothetical protein